MSEILREKSFPSQYPDDAVKVLKAMSFSDGKAIKIVGSQSLRSQMYAGDYDAYETVEGRFPTNQGALKHYVSEFKKIIKNLKTLPNVYIGDIKAGVIEEWRVIPKDKPYDFRASKQKIEDLLSNKIISPSEAKNSIALLKPHPKKIDVLKARDEIKFHIVRWTPQSVLKGSETLRDGRTYTLEEAFDSPTITKLDVIALIQGRYTEMSIIYEFRNGSKVLNPEVIDPEKSLKESEALYSALGYPFKAIKRKFALAKLKNNSTAIRKYHTILNSDLGKLYIVYSDVVTLIDLLEDNTVSKEKIQQAISGFKARLSNIYSLEHYLKREGPLLKQLDSAIKSPSPIPTLKKVEETLHSELAKATNIYSKGLEHYPIL